MRLTVRKKIYNAAKILELNDPHIELLLWLYDNQEYGMVANFERRKWEYIETRNIGAEHFYILCQALIDSEFIKSCNFDMQILVCSNIHLTNLLHKNLKKRIYMKNPFREQEKVHSLFGKGIREMYQVIARVVEKPADLSIPKEIRFSIQGIRIPVAFRPYVASELLTDNEIHNIPENYKYFYFENEHDKKYLALMEEQRRDITKEEKRILLGVLCTNRPKVR